MIRFVTSAREAAIVAITMCLLSLATHAEEPAVDAPPTDLQTVPSPPTPAEEVPSTPPLLLKKAEETHIAVSHSLESMARNIDAFFAADQTFEESTRSYARVRIDTKLDNDLQIGFDGDVRVKIDLPRTERKLKLLIESDDTTRTGVPDRLDDTPIAVVRRQDYLLSIERVNEVNKWDVRPAGSVFWFTSDGLGANTTLDFDRPVGDMMFFRSSTILRWQENDQFLTAEQQLSMYHRLDPKHYLVYQVGVRANQHPDWAMQQYFVAVHYRKNVYRNWLFLELIPQIDYHVERDFEALPSITLRLEGVFGQDYLKRRAGNATASKTRTTIPRGPDLRPSPAYPPTRLNFAGTRRDFTYIHGCIYFTDHQPTSWKRLHVSLQ